MITQKDRKIIENLDLNARMYVSELAKKIKLSRQVTNYRIKKLYSENIIFGIMGVFDSGIMGVGWYRVIVQLNNANAEQKKQVIDYLRLNDSVIWLGEVGGKWDFVVNFAAKNNYEFNSIFEAFLEKFSAFIKNYEIVMYIDLHDYSRSYLYSDIHKRNYFYHTFNENTNFNIDLLDKKLITEISNDARQTNVEIAQKLNVSPNTIKNKLNNFKENKFLLGYRLFVNPSTLNYKSNLVFLSLSNFDKFKEKRLLDFVGELPNVVYVVKQLGRWQIGLELETKDDIEFQDILVNLRSKFSDLISEIEIMPIIKDHIINYYPKRFLK